MISRKRPSKFWEFFFSFVHLLVCVSWYMYFLCQLMFLTWPIGIHIPFCTHLELHFVLFYRFCGTSPQMKVPLFQGQTLLLFSSNELILFVQVWNFCNRFLKHQTILWQSFKKFIFFLDFPKMKRNSVLKNCWSVLEWNIEPLHIVGIHV